MKEISNINLSRLTSQAAFDFLRKQRESSARWTAKSLSLQIAEFEFLKASQKSAYGVSVSKKTAKRAVDRNRMKRRLREAAKIVLQQKAKTGTAYLLSGRAEALTRNFSDLQQDLRWCLEKLKQG